MLNLMFVVMSIALTAVSLTASMRYSPWWNTTAADTYSVVKSGFTTLENAYLTRAQANAGAIPPPTAASDGGLAQYFSPYYGYLPRAPKGFAWKYGYNGSSPYFCLYSYTGTANTTEGIWRGLDRVRNVLSDQQYFIVSGDVSACNIPPSQPISARTAPSSFPVLNAAVYLVNYVAGP